MAGTARPFLFHRPYAHSNYFYGIVRIISPWAISLTSALNRGGLIIHTELIYNYTVYKCPIPIQELQAKEGVGLLYILGS